MNNLFSYIKMGKEILTFRNVEIKKYKFYSHKTPIFLGDVDIGKVLVSSKNCKYFIGYVCYCNKVKPFFNGLTLLQ